MFLGVWTHMHVSVSVCVDLFVHGCMRARACVCVGTCACVHLCVRDSSLVFEATEFTVTPWVMNISHHNYAKLISTRVVQ